MIKVNFCPSQLAVVRPVSTCVSTLRPPFGAAALERFCLVRRFDFFPVLICFPSFVFPLFRLCLPFSSLSAYAQTWNWNAMRVALFVVFSLSYCSVDRIGKRKCSAVCASVRPSVLCTQSSQIATSCSCELQQDLLCVQTNVTLIQSRSNYGQENETFSLFLCNATRPRPTWKRKDCVCELMTIM